MRLRRVRFTVRAMMAVAAVATILLGPQAVKMGRRALYCRGRAAVFAADAEDCRRCAAEMEAELRALPEPEPGTDPKQIEFERGGMVSLAQDCKAQAVEAERVKQLWADAAGRPWKAIPSNLPRIPDHYLHFCTAGMSEEECDRLSAKLTSLAGGPVPH